MINLKKGYLYCIVSAVLFGTAGIFVKLAHNTGLDSVELLTVQYIIAVFLMFMFAIVKDIKKLYVSKKELIHLCILGVFGNTLMTVCYYKAFEYLNVAIVTMLLFTYPIMVFIYTALFNKQKTDVKKIFALFIAFIGCVLTLNILSGGLNYPIKGIVFGLLSAAFYAFMNLYTETKLESVDSLAINAYSTLFSLMVLFIYKSPVSILQGNVKIQGIIYIVILAVICEIIPLTLLYKSIQYIGALKVSVISNLEIPTAMLISFAFLRESVSIAQLIGAALIVHAVHIIKE